MSVFSSLIKSVYTFLKRLWLILSLLFCTLSWHNAANAVGVTATTDAERLLFKSVDAIRKQEPDLALRYLDDLIRKYPNYRLAYLIRGDILMSKVKPISGLGNGQFPPERLEALREEAIARLQRLQEHVPSQSVPWLIWQIPDNVHYILFVETSHSRLFVFRNTHGEISYVTDFYVSIGKLGSGKSREGDQKTPLGVYTVIDNLSKNKLKDLYGSGAFPLNYPNDWDTRVGRTGSGIWLHGVPSDTFSRAPKASDGCVVLANPDFNLLTQYVDVGHTPVIIAAKLLWVHPTLLSQERKLLTDTLEAFRKAWEGKDINSYLDFYSPDFQAQNMRYDQWIKQKREASERKSWRKIYFSNIQIILYPGYERLAEVTFDQDYQSSEFSHKMRKRQYWYLEKGHWKIVYEGTV